MNTEQTTNAETVSSTDWFGEAPPMTPDAKGWWWLWSDEQWCVAAVKHYEGFGGARLRVKWLRQNGGMSADNLRRDEVAEEVWGGRLAMPGASPNDQDQL